MEGQTYEETLIELSHRFSEMEVPVKYVEIDSWWYPKDQFFAVTEWAPDDTKDYIFPNGLVYLQEQTGFKFAAHNRYWSGQNVYATQNGGDYNFDKGKRVL